MIDPAELKSEELLNEIHHQREIARKARSAADRDRSLAINLKQELTTRLEKIDEERRQEIEKTRLEAQKEVDDIRAEVESIRKELSRARQPLEALKTVEQKVEKLEETSSTPVEKNPPRSAARKVLPKIGAKVKIGSTQSEGVITAIGEGDVEVQVGNLRVRVKNNDLHPVTDEIINLPGAIKIKKNAQEAVPRGRPAIFRPSPGMEIDLRGQRADDALDALDRYISNASLAGLPFVRIIPGKGTGRLRQVIREALRENEDVKNFEEGSDKEGGEGVTIAHLNN